ncbi:MAG: hypothetical protein LBF40_01605 [Deltaproteobacteria bacterium]|jgi:hypothetical protein|nr:hypothetical protein [Deltaproteobacteria bacterium]
MSRNLIDKSSLSGSSPSFMDGKAVVAWYARIRDELAKAKGLADFLAEPVIKRQEDCIEWYTSVEGEPIPVTHLPPDQREAAETTAKEKREAIMAYGGTLRASGDPARRQLGVFMLEAVANPSVFELFGVGNSVVAALWGHDAARSLLPKGPSPYDAPPEPEPEPEPVVAKPKGPPLSAKKFFLILATGFITGLVLILVVTFALRPRLLFALNYVFHDPRSELGAVMRDKTKASGAQADLYSERGAYLDRRGSCLIIPKDPAAPYAFAEGCWKVVDQAFLNSETGEPASLSFCYEGGAAEIRIEGQGAPGGGCKAPADISSPYGDISVEAKSEASCGDGKSFPALAISCKPGKQAGWVADCVLKEKNWEGADYPDIPITPRK